MHRTLFKSSLSLESTAVFDISTYILILVFLCGTGPHLEGTERETRELDK